jgi:methionine aminopeptidase
LAADWKAAGTGLSAKLRTPRGRAAAARVENDSSAQQFGQGSGHAENRPRLVPIQQGSNGETYDQPRRPEVRMLDDGWTVVTLNGSLSAPFEHSILVTRDGFEILSGSAG